MTARGTLLNPECTLQYTLATGARWRPVSELYKGVTIGLQCLSQFYAFGRLLQKESYKSLLKMVLDTTFKSNRYTGGFKAKCWNNYDANSNEFVSEAKYCNNSDAGSN